ncbi:cytochrome P450 [Okeania sp. KiyG1]|uniref:cytochrome P450 n=1 Tax=Okeania sp. KiyG1 TaxID=2720165 RepID=UPI001922927E|nr:cytochrome P450 [Okeania sp. KiyG1]GGA27398.1 cytochrome P450 [Okeania sp. KiyG1]
MMKLPDSPKTPHWLQKIQYLTNPISYLESNYQRYGDIFNAPIFGYGNQQFLVGHPLGLQKLFTREGKEIYVCKNEVTGVVVGDNSTLVMEGDSHRWQRKLVMPHLQQKNIIAYGQTICKLTEQVFSQLTPGKTFSAFSVAEELSLEILVNIVFGIQEKERFQQFKQLVVEFWDLATSPLIASAILVPLLRKDWGSWSPWGRFLHLQQQIDQLLYTEIRNRCAQSNPDSTDIMTLLLSARDEDGQGMSDQQLRDELMGLLTAGTETTATGIAWALYWIHYHPEVREKLLQELETLDESPEPMTIFKLPYLTAVCNESLRIYPPVMFTFPREVKEPVELMDFQLEPGTQVYGAVYLTHHREDLYPESKKFKPERFLERKYTPYEFLPFGGGSRRCLGENLALFKMKLALATILDNYQLALVDRQWRKPSVKGIALIPSGGGKMVLKGKR